MKRLIAILSVVVLSGCAMTGQDATIDLPGTSWVLVELDGAEAVGETPPTLAFDDQGSVTGLAGCNSFNAEVTIDGSDLTVGPVASTQMACVEEGVADQEQAFLAALQDATSFTTDDDGRLVIEGGGATLTFEAGTEAE
jgi:heat shock protein HslJ